jgi:hypothetical protein
MAKPLIRQPAYVAAWVLLIVGFGFAIVNLYAVAAVLFILVVFFFVMSVKRAREGR